MLLGDLFFQLGNPLFQGCPFPFDLLSGRRDNLQIVLQVTLVFLQPFYQGRSLGNLRLGVVVELFLDLVVVLDLLADFIKSVGLLLEIVEQVRVITLLPHIKVIPPGNVFPLGKWLDNRSITPLVTIGIQLIDQNCLIFLERNGSGSANV